MTNKTIEEYINAAKTMLDQAVNEGIPAYNMCDGILLNIKGFIHDEVVWDRIRKHEEKLHKEFNKKVDEARGKLKDVDPIFSWSNGMEYMLKLRQWKSGQMLNFYDLLNKEYDL